MEVEAKLAKMQAFVKANDGITADDMSAKMGAAGFQSYETEFLLNKGSDGKMKFNEVAMKYLKGSDMSIGAVDAVYKNVTDFANKVGTIYKMKDGDKKLTTEFKFLNKLQTKKSKESK